jgi:two-component system cell cycle sensor histidine kinase PleC
VVLILGFAFHWQATRAREADLIHDTVRSRIDTALNRGRCGLWDWDIARGRVFWSRSMFDLLGLTAKDDLLTFGEINALVHQGDIDLFEVARQLADGTVVSIDRDFRMRHADGSWLWLRARCELARQEEESSLHLIGIAVDITEQKTLVERTTAADLRLRDAIETIPEAFVLWDADNRLVLCNSNFQALHHLPDAAVTAGTSYEAVVAAGRKPIVRTTLANEDGQPPGARTFEAQLDDGRWMPATSPWAPTSPSSNCTSRSSLRARSGRWRRSTTCANRSRRWNARPGNSPTSRGNTPRKRRAPRKRTKPSRSSWPI